MGGALLAACSSGPLPVGSQDAAEVWRRCSSEEGREALQRAAAPLADGRWREALPHLRRAVESCPRHVPANVRYQDTALRVGGEAEERMRAYYAALETPASRPEARWFGIRLMSSRSRRLLALEELLDNARSFSYGHLARARLLRRFDKLDEAVAAYRTALSLDNGLLAAHRELGEILVTLGDPRAGRPHYESYVRANPTDRTVRRELVRLLLYQLGDAGAARPHVEELLRVDPEDTAALMHRAAVAWRSGRLEQAVATYREVLALDPSRTRAVLNLANLYFEPLAPDEEARWRYWPRARGAYRYFLEHERPSDGYDRFDLYFTVPYRLQEIAELLGPAEGPPPRLEDL